MEMNEVHKHWAETARKQHISDTLQWQELGENVIHDAFKALRLIHILYPSEHA